MPDEMRPGASFSDEIGVAGILLDLLAHRPPWHALAACRGRGVDFFATDRWSERTAAALCALCPVRADCGAWAEGHEEYGTWGGRVGRRIREPRPAPPKSPDSVQLLLPPSRPPAPTGRPTVLKTVGPIRCSCGLRCYTSASWAMHRGQARRRHPDEVHEFGGPA